MLINRQDIVAAEYGLFYSSDANKKLLEFALNNSNLQFLKQAFRNTIIQASYLNDKEMIHIILGILKQGTKIELVLNVLIFADFSRWEQDDIKMLIEFMSEIVDSGEQSLMYKCYNPILTICLCCEFLMKIGNAISFFKHEAHNLSV